MVAVIKTGTSLHRPFNYNENKVHEGHARCIAAVGYPKELDDLSPGNKLNRLVRQAELRPNIRRKAIHISLNFDPSEKDRLTDEKLRDIAADYMKGIGFANQPYLVYIHTDAGHPHIHIVSTKVRSDGTQINMQNIGRHRSEPTRLALEKKYDLVPAQQGNKAKRLQPQGVDAAKVIYGNTPTRRAIQGVLESVLKGYRYGSLQELNALLKLYNVEAYRGSADSRVHKHGGLYYRLLNKEGDPVGVPIKASSIFVDMPQANGAFRNHPTLAYLQSRFIVGNISKGQHKRQLKNTIDLTLLKFSPGTPIQHFIDELHRQGIDTMLRINETRRIYGITYIDHLNKCVFNGSELGKNYSASAILHRCERPGAQMPSFGSEIPSVKLPGADHHGIQTDTAEHPDYFTIPREITELLEKLLGPEYQYDPLPYEYRLDQAKRKKKKRKGQRNN